MDSRGHIAAGMRRLESVCVRRNAWLFRHTRRPSVRRDRSATARAEAAGEFVPFYFADEMSTPDFTQES